MKYDGPALDDGRMPVRDLAPALLALGDLFAEAGKAVNPDAPQVSLNIKATREGSFIVDLILQGADGPWDQMADFASDVDLDALGKLLGTIFGVTGGVAGLIECIKFVNNKFFDKEQLDDGLVKLTNADGNSIIVPLQVERLTENRKVRKSAQAVVAPLAKDGVERVDFQVDSQVVTSVETADVPAFALPGPVDDEEDDSKEQVFDDIYVDLVSPTITGDDYKWRLSMGDGSASFMATIQDESYLSRVRAHEQRFLAGDRLRCTLRIVQSTAGGKLTTEHFVTEVKEHIETPPQAQFEDAGEAA